MAVAAPDVTLEPELGRAVVEVSLPDFAVVARFTVERVETVSGRVSAVRTLIAIDPLGTLTQGFDYELPIDVEVTYRVVVTYDDQHVDVSPPSAAVLWQTDDVWLKDVLAPERSLIVTVVDFGKLTRDRPMGVYDVLTRANPVVVVDTRAGITAVLTLATLTLPERDAMLDLLTGGSTLLFQAPVEYGVTRPLYLVIGPVDELRPSPLADRAARVWTLDVTQVDEPTLGIIVSDYTYQSVLDTYATYQDVLDNEVTYYDLLTSVGSDDSSRVAGTAAEPQTMSVPVFDDRQQRLVMPALTAHMRGGE